MSVDDLDLILKKDPIINTFPVSELEAKPERVEQDYLTHAKTHLSLGDTEKHADTIFKWVSGQNKGTFIGAFEGNYGEGKTSFLVHVWAKSTERKIFTVPPFRWASLADALEAAAAWLRYILRSADPLLGKKAERLHEEFRRKSLEETAGETAAQTGGDYETILATLRYQVEQGIRVTEVTPERFLNYCARATEIVQESGYLGFLVLLESQRLRQRRRESRRPHKIGRAHV